MSNYIKLKEVLDYEQPTAYLVETTHYKESYKIPVLTAGKSFILGYTNDSHNIFPIEKLPVIIFDDFTTNSQYVDFEFKVKSTAMKILKVKGKNDLKYIYYAMKKIKIDNNLHKRYWLKVFSEEKIKLPFLNEQIKIREILDIIQDLINMKSKKIRLLDELIKSKFIEIFGDVSNSKWKTEKLEKISNKITDGKHGGCQKEENSGYYFLGATEIYNNKINYDNKKQITKQDFEKDYIRCDLQLDDFVIVNTGATIGKSAIVKDKRCKNTLLQKSVALIRTNKEKILPVYLKYCYENHSSLYNKGQGCARINLLLSQIKNTYIPVPPLSLQKKFAEIVKQIEEQKLIYEKNIKLLQELNEKLMDQYFN